MTQTKLQQSQSNKLIFCGVLLFLLGLLIALFIPMMANSRMGLSAHLEGVMNGMFLIILGQIWHKIKLNERWSSSVYWLMLYSAFANFTAVTISAITGAGKMMPIAGGVEGSSFLEGLISFLLISLALAIILALSIVLKGLYNHINNSEQSV